MYTDSSMDVSAIVRGTLFLHDGCGVHTCYMVSHISVFAYVNVTILFCFYFVSSEN